MSTVLYAFTASDQTNLHTQAEAVRALIAEDDLIDQVAREEGIEFQVFETSRGLVYRVMDIGYMVKNLMWAHPETFPACNYDNRAEVPEDDQKNESLADEIDLLIRGKTYHMVNVVEKQDFQGIAQT